eukprot:5376408-Pleurochrysis_carterae.AAC.1
MSSMVLKIVPRIEEPSSTNKKLKHLRKKAVETNRQSLAAHGGHDCACAQPGERRLGIQRQKSCHELPKRHARTHLFTGKNSARNT